MTTIATVEPQAVVVWTREQLDLIKTTVCKNELTDDEFSLFIEVAKRKGLDPLQRQIHAIKRWSKAAQAKLMTIQTGIDGYRLIARRNGLAGIDDAVFEEGETYPTRATVTVYRWSQDGQREAYTATAYWQEYYPGDDREGYFWRKMPHGQLAKVAEALALRKGFQELSGLYIDEEMQQAGGAEKPDSGSKPQPQARDKGESQVSILEREVGRLAADYRENVGPISDTDIAKRALGRKPRRTRADLAAIRDWLQTELVNEEQGPDWMEPLDVEASPDPKEQEAPA